MLTVLYKDERGGETLYEAETVQLIPHPRENDPHPADPAPGVLVIRPHGSEQRAEHFAERQVVAGSDKPREIFVMNRFGATVARYGL